MVSPSFGMPYSQFPIVIPFVPGSIGSSCDFAGVGGAYHIGDHAKGTMLGNTQGAMPGGAILGGAMPGGIPGGTIQVAMPGAPHRGACQGHAIPHRGACKSVKLPHKGLTCTHP